MSLKARNKASLALAVVAFCIFSLFTFWQYNDPDIWLWVVVYGYSAALALALLFGRKVFIAALVGLVAYACHLIWIAPTFPANWIEIETSREGIGLMICMAWMIYCAVASKRGF